MTPREFAEKVGVTPATARRWCEQGLVAATHVGAGNQRKHWRIAPSEADKYLAGTHPLQARTAREIERHPAPAGRTVRIKLLPMADLLSGRKHYPKPQPGVKMEYY